MPSIELIIIYLAIIVFSSVCHEFIHGFVAYLLGDNTAKHNGRLSFNPIKHIDPIMSVALPLVCVVFGGPIIGGAKPVPFNSEKVKFGEYGAALVAIAGPLTNLILAFLFMIVAVVINDGGIVGQALFTAVLINISLFAFNLIPIPPLDGSRVLYAFAPTSVQNVMANLERYGLVIVMAIILLFNSIISGFMRNVVQFFVNLFLQILT